MRGETPARTVLWLLDLTEAPIWLDGGWGVDALLGEQTRPHDDVDIFLQERHAQDLVARLEQNGFREIPHPDSRPCNFVLGAEAFGTVDFHLVRFDAAGNGIYGIPDPEFVFPADVFTGRGHVLGRPVLCTSAAHRLERHETADYPLRQKDIDDMVRLARATGAPAPQRRCRGVADGS